MLALAPMIRSATTYTILKSNTFFFGLVM